jgi:predicted protein tyrosine phosphatase
MADSPAQLAKIKDQANVAARLDLVFNDSKDDFGLVRSPSDEDAKAIVDFVRKHRNVVPHVVFQCQVGVGRSLAAYAAILRIYGADPTSVLHRGTHNRALYRKMLRAAGIEAPLDPLVSLAVRVKYSPDRMNAFLLSMQRQRYERWELVFVTDGPNPSAKNLIDRIEDNRVKLIETERPMGRWGHTYRQRGIDACSGDFIGLSNDDNYYVPGYLEQMVNALESSGAELAMCSMLHSYWGWQQLEAGHDLGSWIARRSLVDRTPWNGDDFFYDDRYIAGLKQNAGGKIVTIDRPLFIHN